MSNENREKTMKKISMILGSALMMLAAGCTTDATKEVVNNDNKVVIGLSLDATRTSLGDKTGTEYPVLWSAGDKVAVNGVTSEALAAEYAGKTAAQFTITGVAAPFDVIYPADVLLADGKTISVSEVQEYVAGSFAQGSAIMVGHSDTPNGVIKNLYGFVKVPVLKGDEKVIKSVTLHSNNLEAMTGTFAVDYVNAALEPLSGMDFVKVTAANGIPFVEDKAEVVIAVPAGTYAKGFTVKIVATDGTAMTKKAYAANGVTIAAGTLLAMPEVEFYPNEKIEEITDAAQLQAFLSAASTGNYDNFKNENGEVLLGSDIDLAGVTLTSATTFNGVFNGQGYALKNWKSDGVALFDANSGTIKNIVLDASCELSFPAKGTTFGFIASNNTGTISGCICDAKIKTLAAGDDVNQYNLGVINGATDCSNGASVVNCINNSNIEITMNTLAGTQYIGGIIGTTKSGKSGIACMSNCINNGDIKIVISTTAKNVYLGGVSGSCNNGGLIQNCINNGEVYYEYTQGGTGAYPNVGGITGYTACDINNSQNTGDVTFKTTGDVTRPAVGGIAGYANGNVKDCENYGSILASGNKFAKAKTASSGGVGYASNPTVGGIAGVCGAPEKPTVKHMENCSNYGSVTMVNPNGSCACACAGVVAYASGNAINCHNEGKITVNGGGTQIWCGGVVGIQWCGGDKLEKCTNKGEITVSAGEAAKAAYSYIGGIIGQYNAYSGSTATDCVNEGNITSNWTTYDWVGGLAGSLRGTFTNCVNKGNLVLNNADGATADAKACVAGICGFAGGSTVGCENYGTITNNSTNVNTSASGFLGVAGNTEQSHTSGKVKCAIVSGNGNAAVLLGGQQKQAKVLTAGTEDAPIVILDGTTLNGEAVTAATLNDPTKLAVLLETANVGNIVYTIGSTIKFE